MKYLVDNKYNVISSSEGIEYLANNRKVPRQAVVITFDDGYKNNYTNALPVLKKYNFCSTIFLTVGYLRDYSGNAEYLSSSEIKDIKKSGIVDFGCHGLTHRALAMLGKQELNKEINEAKQKLENIVNDKMTLFAYPFGHSGSFNKSVVNTLKSAGFKAACTTIFGLNHLKRNPYLIRRNRMSWLDDIREFEKHLAGAYDWCALCECFRRKRYGY